MGRTGPTRRADVATLTIAGRPAGLSGMLGALERLDAARWYALPDVAWPDRPPGTHGRVAVGPTGVFVLVDHGWTGRVSVRNALLRVDDRSRDLYVGDAVELAASVAALLPVDFRAHVRAVICLTRQAGVDLTNRDVLVCAPDTIAEVLQRGPLLLHHEHRAYVESVVRAAMRLETEGVVVTVRDRPRRPGDPDGTTAGVPDQRARPVADAGGVHRRDDAPLPEQPRGPNGRGKHAEESAARRRVRLGGSLFGLVVVAGLVALERRTDALALIAHHF